jgi:hypothetical protein
MKESVDRSNEDRREEAVGVRDLIAENKKEILRLFDKRKLEVDNTIRDIRNGMGKAGLKDAVGKKVTGTVKKPLQSSE